MTGNALTFIGVLVSVVGALIAGYGSLRSSVEAKVTDDEIKRTGVQLLDLNKELAGKNDKLIVQADEIAKLNREIADLSQKSAAYAMGSDSYFYLHADRFGGASPQTEVRHVGSNPVRDTEILVYDITSQIPDVIAGKSKDLDVSKAASREVRRVDVSYAGLPKKLPTTVFETNPTGTEYAYFVYMVGGSGTYRQFIHLRKVDGLWRQKYLVERVLHDSANEPVGEYSDEQFPKEGGFISPEKPFPKLPKPLSIKQGKNDR